MGPGDWAATNRAWTTIDGVAPSIAIDHARSLLATAPALAEQQAREVLRVLPDDARAFAIIGAARRRQGDLAAARQILHLVASQRLDVEQVGIELALTMAALGEGAAGLEALRTMARLSGAPVDWLPVAGEFMLAGDPAAAVARAEHLRQLVRGSDPLAAVDALRAGRARDATLMLETHLRRAPDDAPALCAMGEVAIALGRGDEAERSVARAIALAPDMPGARWQHARILLEIDKPIEALHQLDRLAPIERVQDITQFLIASCRQRLGDDDVAAGLTEVLVTKHPGYARLWVLHAAVLRRLGRDEAASAALGRAASLRSDKGEPWWRIADGPRGAV